MKKRVILPDSDRRPMRGAKVVGKVDPHQHIEITIQVRRRLGAKIEKMVEDIASQPLRDRRYLSRGQLAAEVGADVGDVAAVEAFAAEHGLTVTDISIPRRNISLSGTVADMSTAFGVRLKRYKANGASYRGRQGKVSIPSALHGIIERVLGLDDRPAGVPHHTTLIRPHADSALRNKGRQNQQGNGKWARYGVRDVASIYGFPPGFDGTGQTIALIELNQIDSDKNPTGTGYLVSDLQAYFASAGIPIPSITPVGVSGGANVPGTYKKGDEEVTLDIEIAGAIAPGAKIVVYFAPGTDDGLHQALTYAIYDSVHNPTIVSVSWGQAEDGTTKQHRKGVEQALQEAALLGVTVCVSTGDHGSADMQKKWWDYRPHVDFPASCELALACGGTHLTGASAPGAPVEKAWNQGPTGDATGGGVSNFVPKPHYQGNVNVPRPRKRAGGRGVPDVSGHADGYSIFFGGKPGILGGTSCVAPLWAGLLALINQCRAQAGNSPVGYVNPLFYTEPAKDTFHDIVDGNNDNYADLNGKYKACEGWDACTGLGSPDGTKLLAALC